jgi:hypothetical protein
MENVLHAKGQRGEKQSSSRVQPIIYPVASLIHYVPLGAVKTQISLSVFFLLDQ